MKTEVAVKASVPQGEGRDGAAPSLASRLDELCQCHHPRYEHRVAEPYTTTRSGCRRCPCGREML